MMWYGEYVGIPFHPLGRNRGGCDCYGLVKLVLEEQYKIELPEIREYLDPLNKERVDKVVDINIPLLSGKRLKEPKVGSVVVFLSEGYSSHIGIMVTEDLVLHTTKGTGSIIEPVKFRKVRGFYDVNKNYSSN